MLGRGCSPILLIVLVLACALRLPEVSSTPRPWPDLIQYGDTAFQSQEYSKAAAWFREATRQHPGRPIPHLALGHALFAMGNYRESSLALQQGLSLLPQWVGTTTDVRGFFSDRADFGRRLGDLEHHVSAHESDENARFLLAYVYYFSGQRSEALPLFWQLAWGHSRIEAATLFVATER